MSKTERLNQYMKKAANLLKYRRMGMLTRKAYRTACHELAAEYSNILPARIEGIAKIVKQVEDMSREEEKGGE